MSYMRGDVYIWADGERVHFWAADGEDWWEESGWAEGRTTRSASGSGGPPAASGVCLRQEVADAYAMMRLAELVDAGTVRATIDRSLALGGGNCGCAALVLHAERLRHALEPLRPGEGVS